MARIASMWWSVGIVVLVVLLLWVTGGVADGKEARYTPPAKTFDGSSSDLKATAVVPTLDTPLPEGKSAMWCASFEFAWTALREDVIGAPIQVENAQVVADRLNRAVLPDVPASALYYTAGRVTPTFLQRIRDEMKQRFPDAPPLQVDARENDLLAYAWLAAGVSFDIPFFENDEPLSFKDPTGHETDVASFGLRANDDYAYYELRRQIAVLHAKDMFGTSADAKTGPEFIIDPDRTSKPFQLLLARIPRGKTLAETLATMDERIAARARQSDSVDMGPNDVLLVPAMHWRVTHHFRGLEGEDKRILNPGFEGYWIQIAEEGIEFRLDKSGADLRSEAKILCMPIPSHFVFDRPFLVVMRLRGKTAPVFAMWVENAELLVKQGR